MNDFFGFILFFAFIYLGFGLFSNYSDFELLRQSRFELPLMETKVNCEVRNVHKDGDNPEHCLVGYIDDQAFGTSDRILPWCVSASGSARWFFNNTVRLEENGSISIYYNADAPRTFMKEQILIPLMAPEKHRIEFSVEFIDCAISNPFEVPSVDPRARHSWEHAAVARTHPLTFSYSKYPTSTRSFRAKTLGVSEDCDLCRNYVDSYPIYNDRINYIIEDGVIWQDSFEHAAHYYYYVDGQNGKQRPVNSDMMCPLNLTEFPRSGSFYLPFRLMLPELTAIDRNFVYIDATANFNGNRMMLVDFIKQNGVYTDIHCPMKITFSNKYRLLVPPSDNNSLSATSYWAVKTMGREKNATRYWDAEKDQSETKKKVSQ